MADLEALAKRVEAEEPSHNLWMRVFIAVWAGNGWTDERLRQWSRLLNAGALIDAADMLRPAGWIWQSGTLNHEADRGWYFMGNKGHVNAHSEVSGPHAEARAKLATFLRARATTEKQP